MGKGLAQTGWQRHILNMFNSTTVSGRAVGRIAFGLVLLAGAGVLVTGSGRDQAMTVLVMTWAAAFASYTLVRSLFTRGAPVSERLLAASYVVPSVGLALALPVTIQAPFFLLLGGSWAGFGGWVELSIEITWSTHLAFATLAAIRAHRLALGAEAPRPALIYGVCVAVSCVPYILLYAIPPILVALTGLPLVMLMIASEAHIARERENVLASEFPTAIARPIRDAA